MDDIGDRIFVRLKTLDSHLICHVRGLFYLVHFIDLQKMLLQVLLVS